MSRKIRDLILFVIVASLTVYVLKDVDFGEVYSLLKDIDLKFFFLSLVIFPLSLLIWNLRFRYFLGEKANVGFWFLFKVTIVGFFVNTITPGSSFGGEPARIYYLRKKRKVPVMVAIGAILADKFFYLSVFFILSILSLFYLLFFIQVLGNLRAILEIILFIVFVLFGIIVLSHFKRRKIRIKWITNRLYNLNSIKKDFKSKRDFDEEVIKNREIITEGYEHAVKSVFMKGIALSVLYWVPLVLSTYFLFFAFNFQVGILPVSIVVILSYLIGDLSPSPGGVGLMEGTMLLLYSSMGISSEIAIAVALLSRVIYYIYYLGIGGICLLSLRRDNGYLS